MNLYKSSFITYIIFAIIFIAIVKKFTAFIYLAVFIVIHQILLFIRKKIRTRRIASYCEKNNIGYKKYTDSFTTVNESFEVYHSGDVHEYFNEMFTTIDDYEVDIVDLTLFDIERKRGCGGKDSGLRPNILKDPYTLCQISNKKFIFPEFTVKRRIFIWDKLFENINRDILFEEDRAFSNKFVLRGRFENDVRKIFGSSTRKAFLDNHKSGFMYEGKGHTFLLYCKGFATLRQRLDMMNRGIKIFKEMESISYTKEKKNINYGKRYVPKKSPFENLGLK